MTPFSEEGDSGAKLQIEMKSVRLQGKQTHASIVWITHTQQMINKGRTEATGTVTTASAEAAGTSRKAESLPLSQLFTHLDLQRIE